MKRRPNVEVMYIDFQERRRPILFSRRISATIDVGDTVYLTLKGLKQDRPSPKLSDKSAGPFKILAKVGNAFKLQLPGDWQIHDTFAPDKLRRGYTTDEPLKGQIADPEPPIQVLEHEEYGVEKILASKLQRKRLIYKVKWEYEMPGEDEWIPASNLKNSARLLAAFHAAHPEAPGPPKRLKIWLQADEDDVYVEDHQDDNRAA
ncbi:Retrovirus polyprotein [Penicillium verhagenii]|uniref:Retrovirus polyprotein n=1 Tax=Penicillium verhagenii TaxID=1562060 RepID=UPI002544EC0F|nr:Retrovirus polyprotein [Penicillium verhagenii]KAJ5930935.1 Retrovirus polyprotein [Penicillium verhagenii]